LSSEKTEILEPLFFDYDITEIIFLGWEQIYFEKKGSFQKHECSFNSSLDFQNFIHEICDESGVQFNYEKPFADGQWRQFRLHIASPPLANTLTLTLRRLKQNSLSLSTLEEKGWCSSQDVIDLRNLIQSRKNILVVGSTGSGKTTVLNSLLRDAASDRCVFIEDTPELLLPNDFSSKLLTRVDYQGQLPDIQQGDLLKQTLRMRPDRLIVGEIRGTEAKDLLLALSTGHSGSMASLHAGNPAEALLRLEMLVQMGAPQWSLLAIRRLIQLTIDVIIVTKKIKNTWQLDGLYKIASLEEFGFSVERIEYL
jgi:pilus assembly protein CpaF